MRVVLKEMKKILNLKVILLLTVFTLLYFAVFPQTAQMAFDSEYYYNNMGAENDLYRELVDKFGPTLSSDETSQMDLVYEEEYKALDAVVQKNDELRKEGITTFTELALHSGELKYNKIYIEILRSSGEFERAMAIEHFRNLTIGLSEEEAEEYVKYDWNVYSKWHAEKKKELYMRDEISLIPERIVEDSFEELGYIAVWITICCLIIVLPFRVKENLSGVKSLGTSAKEGRNLYVKQWLAAMVSCVLVSVVQLVLYAVCLYKAGYLSFWQCPDASQWNLYWIDMSYGTHLLVYALLIMLFAAIAGTVFFLISGANSYMRAISFGVPCCAFLAFIAWKIFDNLFSIPEVVFFKLSELYAIGILLIAVSLILFFSIRKNEAEDVGDTL